LALDDRRMRLGDDILVLDRDDRDVEAEHLAGLTHEIAGGGHQVLAGYVALIGGDLPFAGRRLGNCGDAGLAVDPSAAVAGALGERLGQVGGLDIAVIGMLDGAENALDIAQRPDLLDLIGGQKIDLDADGLGDAGVVHVLVPAVAGAG
jgi:hypothetical protein